MNRKFKSFIILALTLIGLVSLVGVAQPVKVQTQTQDDDQDPNDGSEEQDEGEADNEQDSSDEASDGQGAYASAIDPVNFVSPVEIGKTIEPNPYFLLLPGYTRIYKQGSETITVRVTSETKEIMGVTCAVIHDVVEDNSEIIEDTYDWYAQDKDGNVWYFGEATQAFKDGETSTARSRCARAASTIRDVKIL